MTSPTGSPTAANLGSLVLAISTSGPRGSLALAGRDKKVFGIEWEKRAVHSELATLKLQELLRDANLTLRQLTHIAVTVGPGSFTGIRVGVNLAKTLGYALGLPVAPLISLDVIARRELQDGERGLVALRAIEGHYYAGLYAKRGLKIFAERPPFSATPAELDGLKSGRRALIEGFGLHDAGVPARELLEVADTAEFISWDRVNPLYIRASEAEEKMRKGLLKPLV